MVQAFGASQEGRLCSASQLAPEASNVPLASSLKFRLPTAAQSQEAYASNLEAGLSRGWRPMKAPLEEPDGRTLFIEQLIQ